MESYLFSIIVPCYNVQDYLEECINSILAQSYSNYEVIVVDDGSTDNTSDICNKIALLDNRIAVYHKKNGGLSDARNYGMERAKGDYLVFVDSDDFISSNALNNFAIALDGNYPDVLLTRLTEYYDKNNIVLQDERICEYFDNGITVENALRWETNGTRSTWPAQKKIISRKFIHNNGLKFLKGFLHEDVDWSSRVLMVAESFAVCEEPWYYHRIQRNGSIMNTISVKRILDVIEMASSLIFCDEMENNIPDWKRDLICGRIMRSVYPILAFYEKLSRDDRKKVVVCCEKNKELFALAPRRKYKIFSLCSKYLGFHISLELLAKMGGIV